MTLKHYSRYSPNTQTQEIQWQHADFAPRPTTAIPEKSQIPTANVRVVCRIRPMNDKEKKVATAWLFDGCVAMAYLSYWDNRDKSTIDRYYSMLVSVQYSIV